ncbi:probable protein phosphatase 2C 73 [Typha angustifolia]|uniref:probable protein phosphatase 2C 73 n=1 Tax=Typha angustifolia TaxID=59011 RepID=UPI003C2B5304
MGGCCGKQEVGEGLPWEVQDDEDFFAAEEEKEDKDGALVGDASARVRLKGSCLFASMYSQQGWKGVNQDAMTIWEDFAGDEDQIFCGVFDGHGPFGHKVSGHVRDVLPSKLSSLSRLMNSYDRDDGIYRNENSADVDSYDNPNHAPDVGNNDHQLLSSWKAIFVKAFEDLDEELSQQLSIDCICSGTTAVSIVKQREHLVIGNLGDSRAVLCTRDDKNEPIAVQLTTDLKPNLPSEEERIKSCRGRVFALKEEPDIHRMWLPDEDSPGLAMARAFGDFCLKDFGLISTPQVSHWKISEKDEFVVLATDGVWDVLSNKEVVNIVSSVSKQSDAAKHVVNRAVRAWRSKHPTSKIDDCAVVCLFLKQLPSSNKQNSGTPKSSARSCELSFSESFKSARSEETLELEEEMTADSKGEWNALEGVSRANSVLKIPRLTSVLSWRKRSTKVDED